MDEKYFDKEQSRMYTYKSEIHPIIKEDTFSNVCSLLENRDSKSII
jgi:hypothetical protein